MVTQVRGGVYVNKSARSNAKLEEAEWLLGCCASDGAIGEEPTATVILPYMANYAAMGLVRAYEMTGNSNYIDAVWNWLEWYRDHMDPTTGYVNDYNFDGSGDGGGPAIKSPDSTDAYAGTYLVALLLAYDAAPDGDAKLIPFYNSIPLALTAIESTQQSDGLTYALPTYDVKYLEDNIETLAGVRAAEVLAALPAVVTAKPTLLARAQTTGDAMAQGVGYMWNHDAVSWDYAIHSSHFFAVNNWADNNAQRQQVWATAWGAIASLAEGRDVMANYALALPDWSSKSSSYEPIPVWGYRRVGQSDVANSGAINLQDNGRVHNRGYPWTSQISGMALIGLFGFSPAMPDPRIKFPTGENLMPDSEFVVDTDHDGRPDVIAGTYGDPQFSLHPLGLGGNYLRQTTPDGSFYAFNWAYIPVEANTYVTFSFFERITHIGAGGNVTIKYELYDASNNLVTYGYNTKDVVSGPEFNRWYLNVWIPEGATQIRPVLENNSSIIEIADPQVEVAGSPTKPPYGIPVPA